jgi:hypothetical protein
MIKITIPDIVDGWDPVRKEFVNQRGATLVLEHSLVSVQKWESKWHIPYTSTEKTNEQVLDYIKCMVVFPHEVDDKVFDYIPKGELKRIADYIHDPMTATTFSDTSKSSGKSFKQEKVTAEIVYYWMIAFNIPMEYRKWHFNQLLTLIHVCELKQGPQQKMGKNEILARNKALNAQRRAKMHSKG